MPTYQYACTACEHRFEAVQSFSDASLTECPECSGRLRKLYGSVGVVFKGSGFYRTDSRAESAKSDSASSETSSSSDGKSSDSKSDSKSSDGKSDGKSSDGKSSSSSSSSSSDKSSGSGSSSSAGPTNTAKIAS